MTKPTANNDGQISSVSLTIEGLRFEEALTIVIRHLKKDGTPQAERALDALRKVFTHSEL